ncbi:MAG: type IV pilus inner membrane component PilO [Fimbriimonadaceae bacterium]
MTSRPNPKAFMYLALSTVLVGGGLCYYQFTKLGDLRGRVAKLRGEVSDPKSVKEKLDQSSMKLQGAQQSLMHLEANVSSAAYVPSLLRDLDGYGKQNGIDVTGVRPAPPKPGDDVAKAKATKPYDELNIQVTGTGSFKSIENFVANLPSFPKIVAARMVSIEPARTSAADAKPGTLNMTVQLLAYVFKGDASAQASTTPTQATTQAPANAITGVSASPTGSAAATAQGGTPPDGAPATPGSPVQAATPNTTVPPAPKRPAQVKTALGRARRVRVEG